MGDRSRREASAAPPLDLSLKIIMLMGGALAALALTGINSVLPAIDNALAHGAQQKLMVKQLVGFVGLGMTVGCILAGFFAERVGMRKFLAAAIFVYVLGGTAGLYLSNLDVLLFSRFMLGLSAAALQISSLTLINKRLQSTDRAHWMGLHISASLLGILVLQPIAGLIGNISWRLPFALYALGLLTLPAILIYKEQPQAQRSPEPGTQPPKSASGRNFLRKFPYHYLPLAILVGSIVFLPAIYAPFVLRSMGLGRPSTIALVLTADSIAGAIVASQYGRARRHVSRHAAFALSFAVATVGMLVVGLSSNPIGVIGGMLFYGLGTGWFVPNLMTGLGEKLDSGFQARAVGLVKAAHFSSSGVALFAMAPIVHRFGEQRCLLFIAATAAVLSIGAIFRMRTTPPTMNRARVAREGS